jgi:hypothetical protein
MPEVGQHVDAAPLDLRGLRILVLVNHVLVDRQRHQGEKLRLGPRLAERGQVLAGVAIEHQLVRHDLERLCWLCFVRREPILGDRPGQVAPGEHAVLQLLTDRVALVQGHGRHLLDQGRSSRIPRGLEPSPAGAALVTILTGSDPRRITHCGWVCRLSACAAGPGTMEPIR